MKTKHLIWAALALPAIFAACSNEEFMTETNNPAVNSEVIEGIKFTVTKGDGVDTRLNENGWEDGDIVGLAYRGEWRYLIRPQVVCRNRHFLQSGTLFRLSCNRLSTLLFLATET